RIPSESLPEESEGVPLDDVWDMPIIAPSARERLGYPTQKPLALLERIVSASSNPGDIVLDPFCGCGTAIVAAQRLKRKWIGIDITHLAIALIKYRLADSFDIFARKNYKVVGEPVTISEARALANDDRDEFQKWAVGLVDRARLAQEQKGADKGIDGMFYFIDDPKKPVNKVVLQVKSGHVTVSQIRDLCGVLQREKAAFGLFITLENPTSSMRKEAETVRFYDCSDGRKYPRLQIRTIGELLKGESFDLPPYVRKSGIKRAGKVGKPQNENETLTL
ncbi:MAG: site-specific DNA-methyltransferase, partial [Calditrichaeota bacterium]|nr:site-specific DNA-methyltransferase [Calditrichota bacterium]